MSTWKIFALVVLSRSVWASTDKVLLVLGGENAQQGEFPFMARILHNSNQHCGGSIISSEWILTAAQCTFNYFPEDLEVHYGSVDIYQMTVADVTDTFTHPAYEPSTFLNDIGLMKIYPPVALEGMRRLLKAGELRVLENERTAITLGWGRLSMNGAMARILQKLRVEMLTDYECKEILGDQYHDFNVCGYNDIWTDLCKADGGGPLVVGDEIIGVSSWGPTACTGESSPMIFTRISYYMIWIQNIMNDN